MTYDYMTSLNCSKPVSEKWRALFASHGILQTVKAGDMLLQDREAMPCMICVTEGCGLAYSHTVEGEKSIYYFFSEGCVLGDASLFSSPSPNIIAYADISMLSDGHLLLLPYDFVRSHCETSLELLVDLQRVYISKLLAISFMRTQSLLSAYERVICFLYIACTEKKKKTLAVTQTALAEILGLHPISVAKELQYLEKIEVIFRGRGHIHILDPKKLQLLCQKVDLWTGQASCETVTL